MINNHIHLFQFDYLITKNLFTNNEEKYGEKPGRINNTT